MSVVTSLALLLFVQPAHAHVNSVEGLKSFIEFEAPRYSEDSALIVLATSLKLLARELVQAPPLNPELLRYLYSHLSAASISLVSGRVLRKAGETDRARIAEADESSRWAEAILESMLNQTERDILRIHFNQLVMGLLTEWPELTRHWIYSKVAVFDGDFEAAAQTMNLTERQIFRATVKYLVFSFASSYLPGLQKKEMDASLVADGLVELQRILSAPFAFPTCGESFFGRLDFDPSQAVLPAKAIDAQVE